MTDCLTKIDEFSTNFGYSMRVQENGNEIRFFNDNFPTVVALDKEGDNYFMYLYVRTHSSMASGDRTDIHEITAIIHAICLRYFSNISSTIIGESNSYSGIDEELYSVFVIPSQTKYGNIKLNSDKEAEFIQYFLASVYLINQQMCNIVNCLDKVEDNFSYSDEELLKWKNEINNNISNKHTCLFNLRTNPKWKYYRNPKNGISVISSQHVANAIKNLAEIYGKECIEFSGINGNLYIFNNLSNYISKYNIDSCKNIFPKEFCNDKSYALIPLENKSVLCGSQNIIIFNNNGTLDKFIEEKEKIKKRHIKESLILFSDKEIVWNITEKDHSAIFEDLILSLLNKEPDILFAKKVAPTNQGDNGRDIICEYNTNYLKQTIEKGTPQINRGRMIVQCKTKMLNSKIQSVGKSNVDISDTIYDYKPDRYLLVVNTQITRDLTEYLEKLRYRGETDVDWWNSFDIEERLRKNPEIINRFSQIIRYK